MLEHLFSPLRLGRVDLQNRIVSTAHQTTLVRDHLPTDDFVAYHEVQERGGAGLIILDTASLVASDVSLQADALSGFRQQIICGP